VGDLYIRLDRGWDEEGVGGGRRGGGGGEYIVVRGDEWKIYHPGFFPRVIFVRCEV
jgi:hypothetical protein